jgi:hypothetical protein
MGLGLRRGEGVEVVLKVRVKVVVGLSQHYKAEGYVYPGGRFGFCKAAEENNKNCPQPCITSLLNIASPGILSPRRRSSGVGLRLGQGEGVKVG